MAAFRSDTSVSFKPSSTALFPDEVTRILGIAETFHFEAVDLVVPPAGNGPRLEAILEAQVAQHLLERQLRQIVHRLHFGSVHLRWQIGFRFELI